METSKYFKFVALWERRLHFMLRNYEVHRYVIFCDVRLCGHKQPRHQGWLFCVNLVENHAFETHEPLMFFMFTF